MYRCTNEECRQALYIKLGPETFVIKEIVGTMEPQDDVEVECPVCGCIDRAGNWKKCWEDPLPFTFLEKGSICQCGGEIVQSLDLRAAMRMANSTMIKDSKPGLVCEDCGAPAAMVDKKLASQDPIPTIEEIKRMRGFGND